MTTDTTAIELTVPDGRLPEAIEAAAYYVVCEALVNVTKYAGASAATVSVAQGGIDPVADALIGSGASIRSRTLVGSHATRYTVPSEKS